MVVDYKSRKNEVLASYDTVEKLIKDLPRSHTDTPEPLCSGCPDG